GSVCAPAGRAVVVKEALPPTRLTVPRSVAVVVSKKSTVPVGVPDTDISGVTVAVNVTGCPKTVGFAEDTTLGEGQKTRCSATRDPSAGNGPTVSPDAPTVKDTETAPAKAVKLPSGTPKVSTGGLPLPTPLTPQLTTPGPTWICTRLRSHGTTSIVFP